VLGQAACVKSGSEVAVLTIGAIGNVVADAIRSLGAGKRNLFAHYDMRWLKPIDELVLEEVAQQFTTIVTVEDGMVSGGLGSAVLEYMADHGHKLKVIRLGVHDQFVEHGSTKELYHLLKLDKEGIANSLLESLE
jgi:1-deoxy-D-xylulose-5-phosphate synthase